MIALRPDLEPMDKSRPETIPRYVQYCIYTITVIALAIATFGPTGFLAGMLLAVAWGSIFLAACRPRALLAVLVIAVTAGFVFVCSMPRVSLARELARFTQCRNNIKQVGLALHNYHDDYGSFPPAHTVDANGRPLHSWRVLILPYLDDASLYDKFRLDEPWDSPHNLDIAAEMPVVYDCPSRVVPAEHHHDGTSYVAVVGDGTIWPEGGKATRLSDIRDGTERTIALIESYSDIPWTEPRDLTLDEGLNQLTASEPSRSGGHRSQSYFFDDYYGRTILFADGSVGYSGRPIDRDTWTSLLMRDDGAPPADWALPHWTVGRTRIARIGNWVLLGAVLIAALFPLPWVWLNPTSGRRIHATC